MKKLFTLGTCLLVMSLLHAQTDTTTPVKQKSFNVSIRTLDNRMVHGRLLSVNDSQLVLIKPNGQYPIPAENIRSFTLKRKNTVLKGTLIGLAAGTVTGIVAGFASGDDPIMQPSPNDWGIGAALNNAFAMTAKEKAMAMGAGLGVTGALVGTIVGVLAKKKFTIGGRKEKFRDLQSEIMMKLIRK